jgi:cytochrome c biogenesis protein CcmG, thiol:disulfide interchange protein DsbE
MKQRPLPRSFATVAALSALSALLWACAAAPAQAQAVGAAAPAIQLPGLAGPVDSAALAGKVVVVDFWASWCAPCKRSFPWWNEMQAKYGARGLQVLAVNVDRRRADADAWLAQAAPRFAVAFDAAGETPKRFAVKAMPTSLLVGADGRVALRHEGFKDEDRAALEAAIVAALGRAGR